MSDLEILIAATKMALAIGVGSLLISLALFLPPYLVFLFLVNRKCSK